MATERENQNTLLIRLLRRFDALAVQLKIRRPEAIQLMTLMLLEDLVGKLRAIGLPEYKTEFVNATVAGNTEVVERVPGKKLRVFGYVLNNQSALTATVHFRSGTRPISADKELAGDGGGMTTPVAQGFWFETAVGEALNINLLAAGAVGVDVTYSEVEP